MAKGKKKARPAVGVVFPLDKKGGRSTTSTGKQIIAAALRGCADGGDAYAAKVERERNWRFGYNQHIINLVELSLSSPEAALGIAKAGLSYMHSNFQFIKTVGAPGVAFGDAMQADSSEFKFHTGKIEGTRARDGLALAVPYNGGYSPSNTKPPTSADLLTGDSLKRQLNKWAELGVMEADAAKGVGFVSDYFEGKQDLSDYYFILIGAGSAMGPFNKLLELGANVIALDIPGKWGERVEGLWKRLTQTARDSPGTIYFPLSKPQQDCKGDEIYAAAGADLLNQPMHIQAWVASVLRTLPPTAKITIGNYTYLDGAMHVKLALAADAIIGNLRKEFPKLAVAFLCTPTDMHVIPPEAHAAAEANCEYHGVGWFIEKLVQTLSFGKKLAKNALKPLRVNGKSYHLVDGLSVAQGPNYAIAKRAQHWRAQIAFEEGAIVSSRVAPSTATVSVIHNKTFQWAYFGMRNFKPLEIFHQETTNAVMAALLIHDVVNPESSKNPANRSKYDIKNTLELFRTSGVHGGVWRTAYKLDSIGEYSVLVYFLGGPGIFPYAVLLLLSSFALFMFQLLKWIL